MIKILKIFQNPNKNEYAEITKDVESNDGYCPCVHTKSVHTKCICLEFKNQNTEGFCRCGRYKKILIKE